MSEQSYLAAEKTLGGWLGTHDHKKIGLAFLISTSLMLFLGGVFALLMRLELATPDAGPMDPSTYNRLFTLHGVTMVWLFMIPSIPAAFGNFVLPLMIGARDVAFPRLNLLSLYIYLLGAVVTLAGMFWGGADTGWTFYVPYSTESPTAVVPIVAGVFILGWSTIITGINFIVTTHTLRAEGVRWFNMPLFVWTIYATSIIQVLATPVLGMSLTLVGLDYAFDWGIFDPDRGGDPILYQHIFWFYSHPAVYIMVLPAMGVVSEVVCSYARKNPLSYTAIAWSSMGIALVGFLSWGHHMFTSGMSELDAAAFGILTMLVAIFSAIKVFTWTGTLFRGSIAISAPLVYIFGFLFLFIFGGMTGVATATVSLDVHWHDTYFIVAHFHFIMVGGTLTAFLAALHYWWPKITGRLYPERWGIVAAVLVIVGFILTFVPQFLLGNAGMPRRYATYPPEYQALHVISTAGSWLLFVSLAVTVVYLGWSLRRGERAGPNPWGSAGHEWKTISPPPEHNWVGTPVLDVEPYDYRPPGERLDPEGPHA